jgi:CubicO group peptidase (beta-lactamase class C family)
VSRTEWFVVVGARIAIVLGLLALACSTAGGTRPGPGVSRAKARVDSIVAAVMAERHIPGVTLLVEHRGLRIVAREYGLADLENKVPAELETVYQIASLTKQFTAAAILQLVEQRKVQLRDQVTKFVPELRILTGSSESAAARHELDIRGRQRMLDRSGSPALGSRVAQRASRFGCQLQADDHPSEARRWDAH